jgi:tetratricopeptide (TPR) repeat protein
VLLGYAEDTAEALASARAAAEQAVSLDPNEPMARFALGRVHTFAGETEMAIGEMQTAIAINPNFAWGHHGLAHVYYYSAGQAEQSLPHFDAALRLNPRDPWRWRALHNKGSALRFLGRHDEAIAHCRQACQFPDTGFLPNMLLAASLAEAGQESEAQAAVEKAVQLEPALSIGFIRSQFVGAHKTYLKSLLDSLRKAGVPE